MGVFVCLTLGMVAVAMRQHIELESDDYYARELVYEHQLRAFRQARDSGWLPAWTSAPGCLQLDFTGPVQGEVRWIRPSQQAQDFAQSFQADSVGYLQLCDARMVSGIWKVEVRWVQQGKACYSEQTLRMP